MMINFKWPMKLSSTKILKFILKCKSPHPAIAKGADFCAFTHY